MNDPCLIDYITANMLKHINAIYACVYSESRIINYMKKNQFRKLLPIPEKA